MGIKEYIYHDEHWVMYKIAESLYCTPKTNIILHVNSTEIKMKTLNTHTYTHTHTHTHTHTPQTNKNSE